MNHATTRIRPLDGLRGTAILMVLMHHLIIASLSVSETSSAMWGKAVIYLNWFFRLAGTGVDLFFVLSGYLMGRIILKHAGAPGFLPAFFIRRAGRILPAYFLLLFSWILVNHVAKISLPGSLDAPLIPFWTYPLFLQNFAFAIEGAYGSAWLAPTWSLCVEEQFYLLAPLVAVFFGKRNLVRTAIVAVPLALVLRSYIFFLLPGNLQAFYTPSPCRMDGLALGLFASALLANPERADAIRREKSLHRILLFLGFAGFVYLTTWQPHASIAMTSLGYTLVALFYTLIVTYVILHGESLTSRFFAFRPLGEIGRISYMVYLSHMPVFLTLFYFFKNSEPQLRSFSDLWLSAAAFIATILFSALSWKIFESPILKRVRAIPYERGN